MPIRMRMLLTALTAPALAVVVGSAVPAQAAPISYTATFHAEAQVTLPDGRSAELIVDRYVGSSAATTFTEVEVDVACASARDCPNGGVGVLDLAGNEARFAPGLGRMTLAQVSMTVYGWTGRNPTQQTETPITVSAVLTANGPLTASVNRGTSCADPTATQCRSIDTSATRSATAVLTIDGVGHTGTGSMSSGRTLSVVAHR
ncbi:hypothetical protein SAMN05660199_00995 [Klenkia soli]|uniref:Uncharacterized protein n=1 Tax=Klenkia soli TaxID=1052260 RepID=A0A1H0FRA3_9ACTN|nr:hypothetical protein [Klenkia soli]SDN97114.1 hypothetical protein SAMN05660199_00995 [Klenkia soli]